MLEQRRMGKNQNLAVVPSIVNSGSNSEQTVSPPNQTSTFNPAQYNQDLPAGELDGVDQLDFGNPETLYS